MPRQYTPRSDVICAQCGKSYTVNAARVAKAHYCSIVCKAAAATIPINDRLLKYGLRSPIGCLLWTGFVNPLTGYGKLGIGKRLYGAHAAAYREWVGPIPQGHQVHHLCDVRYAPGDITYRRCFEPTHLTTGTPKVNQEHMAKLGRSATGARNGKHTHPEKIQRGDHHWRRRGRS